MLTTRTRSRPPAASAGYPLTKGELRDQLAFFGMVGVCVWFWDSWILWPLKMAVVAVHELGHALMTWVTGGSVVGFGLWIDQSGHVLSQGGNRFLILNAGYLGSLLFGVLLLGLLRRPSTLRNTRARLLAWAGRFFGMFSVLYAFIDIRDDVLFGVGRSDASMLAELTGVPGLLWGLVWCGVGAWLVWRLRRWLI